MEPTELEAALLAEFSSLYKDCGFPSPTEIAVVSRENTGAGRYLQLQTASRLSVADGYLDLRGRFIEMNGVPHGMMAVVLLKEGQPVEMEIAVYGTESWDGEERSWSLR